MSASGERGRLIVLVAPSGSGKSTVIERAMRAEPGLEFSVSLTTREARPDEVDGRDYFFVSEETFRSRIDEDGFLEWAEVHGHYYGTDAAQVQARLDRGVDVLLDIDVQGAQSLQERAGAAVYVFLLPPSFERLEQRLRGRGTESERDILTRLRNSSFEVGFAERCDFVVINEELDQAVEEFVSIVRASRAHVRTRLERVRAIVATFHDARQDLEQRLEKT